MNRLLSILCIALLASCAGTDYVLPPKAIIVPVDTARLEAETKEHGNRLRDTGESVRKTGEALDRAYVTAEELNTIVDAALANADGETRRRVAEASQRHDDELMAAKAESVILQGKYDSLLIHFDDKVNERVKEVAQDAKVNKQGIAQNDKVDAALRETSVSGLKAKEDLIKEDAWGDIKMWAAIAGFSIIALYLLIRFAGAAIWAWLKTLKPW